MFISQTTYSEDSIYKRRNCNLKLKSSFTKVKRIIPEKITIAIQYRHKKRCTANCQDHREMKPLLKQKLKDRLQKTRQSARNRESRTLGLEAIGKLCRHERIIYYSSKQNGKNGFVTASQRINVPSFSFQMAGYLALFLLLVFNEVFKTLIVVKLFKIVDIIIRPGAPLGLAFEMN